MERHELVTTALLGFDRRPVPTSSDGDPAVLLLDQAVRSSVAGRAGAVLSRLPPPVGGPPSDSALDHPPWAPPAAQELVARLLVRPQAELVGLWLRAAASAGRGLAPQHWPAVVAYAARSAGVDRSQLAAVLGPAGRWFAAQNPQWANLAGELETAASALTATAPPGAPTPGASIPVEPRQLQGDPELIFTAAEPWSRPLVEVALMIVGTGRLQWRTTAYASSLGARMPFEHLPLVRSAGQFFAPADGPPASRIVREAFSTLDQVPELRVEIEQAFGRDPEAALGAAYPHDQESS